MSPKEKTTKKSSAPKQTTPKPSPKSKKISFDDLEEVQQPQMVMPQSPENCSAVSEPEYEGFYVQNINASTLFISDLKLQIKGFDAVDLAYLDPKAVERSADLRYAIKTGQLKRLTRQELEIIENRKIEAERIQMAQQQKKRKRQLVAVDDKQLEAEVINLNMTDSGVNDEDITTVGSSNDPTTYSAAFMAASAEAAARGEYLDAQDFYQRVKDNPGIVQQYVNTERRGRGVTSGAPNRGRAVVTLPPTGTGGQSTTGQFQMSNLNRDHRLAGAEYAGMDMAPEYESVFDNNNNYDGLADVIDLADDQYEDYS